ncbi:hypothetical protein DH2020_037698 [Rehmannia glutinosa]|uniref:Hydroxyproline-rich glycoprotein family protein n=1 Tax=Rehmannia glutinosa TaxID=99300 RepID=A0ABR0V1C5_REHGL
MSVLGFPLRTAFLLLVIFTLSGVISCCYHWDNLRRSFSLHAAEDDGGDLAGPSNPKNSHMDMKQKLNQSLPVIMAGDNVPKFMALPCPCEPPRQGEIIVEVQKPPPKPPRIAVHLY